MRRLGELVSLSLVWCRGVSREHDPCRVDRARDATHSERKEASFKEAQRPRQREYLVGAFETARMVDEGTLSR